MFVPLPCNGPISVSSEEKKRLWKVGALFLRYPAADDSLGYPSYIHMVDDKNYDLQTLTSHQRQNTRRGLRNCKVESIPIDVILREGPPLIEDTYDRHGRRCTEQTLRRWRNFFLAARDNPLFQAWEARVGTQLAACALGFTYRDVFYLYCLFNRRDLLKHNPMNALLFTLTRETIKKEGISAVSYGIRAIFGDKPSLNRFKESVGYRKVLICERIEVNPLIKPVFDFGLARVIRAVATRYFDRSQRAKRIHGIISTYLEQKKDCMAKHLNGSDSGL